MPVEQLSHFKVDGYLFGPGCKFKFSLAKRDLHLLFFWSFEEEGELFIVPALLRRARLTSEQVRLCSTAPPALQRLASYRRCSQKRCYVTKHYNLMSKPAEVATNKPYVALSETKCTTIVSYSSKLFFRESFCSPVLPQSSCS